MNLDNELLLDAQEDAQELQFIKSHLPIELQDKMTEEQLYYLLDTVEEYYIESGLLESEPDADGFIDINVEDIAIYLSKQMKKDNMGDYSAEDLQFFVEAELEYSESLEE